MEILLTISQIGLYINQGVWKSRALSAQRWSENFEMNELMKKTF